MTGTVVKPGVQEPEAALARAGRPLDEGEAQARREQEGVPAAGRRRSGLQFMVAGAFCFSVMSLLVKLAGERLPTQEIVFARSALMAAICAALLRSRGVPLAGQKHRLLVLRGLFGFGSLSCFYYGVVHLPLADATVIQYTNAVFTSLFAVFALKERLRPLELACLALALTGVLVAARPSFLFPAAARLPAVPVAVALAGACFSGAAYVTVRRIETEDPLVVIFYFSAIGTIGSLPFLVHSGLWPTPLEWLLLLGVGLTTQAGQVLLTHALYRERAGRVSSAGLVQIVFALAWGALWFGELPDRLAVIGALMIVGAVLALGPVGRALAPVPGSPSIAANRPRPPG
jgi:drug/metabolite transporter (DMT)-like permease